MTRILSPPPLPRGEVWLRLLARIDFLGDCWVWTGWRRGGQVRSAGPQYGGVRIAGRAYYVHRLVVWIFRGEWPEVVDHAHGCAHGGLCVNPHYLRASTKAENDALAAALTNGGTRPEVAVELDPIW